MLYLGYGYELSCGLEQRHAHWWRSLLSEFSFEKNCWKAWGAKWEGWGDEEGIGGDYEVGVYYLVLCLVSSAFFYFF